MNLKDLPKVELHRHLELSLRHSTIRELAPQIGVIIKNDKDFADHFLIEDPMLDLQSVLHKFLDTQKLLHSEEIIERIAFEAVEDAARENIRWLELRYAPTFVNQGHPHLNFKKIHSAIVRGVKLAESKYNIGVGLIGIVQRTLDDLAAQAVAEFIMDHNDTFLAMDLADNEAGFDAKRFSKLFQMAKDVGLGITVHAGEVNTPEAPTAVKEAIEYLGADRIGHGVQIYRDPEIMNYVKQAGIPLELCPTSNYLTQAVPTVDDHPLKQFMDFGIIATINSDDPGTFNINLTHEFELAKSRFKLTDTDILTCVKNAAQHSFIEDARNWSP
ncbi:MAG: adenosine deaminase [Pseudobdellovibrionaceae bacterium]|nr:adenosine deaminase [Bdellovibrionales bacterium]USN46525.1 MAG: adenosine deaminase [Pseudobdellovibrionaceae bacterium]